MLVSKTSAQDHFCEEWPSTGRSIELNQPETIAEALTWALLNRTELHNQRRKSWENARTLLNWESESELLIELVQKMTSEQPPT